jgi:hypothetical protein
MHPFNRSSPIVYSSVKQIEWEQFIMNIVAHNLVIQMRMYKKAREKRALSMDATLNSFYSSAHLNNPSSGTSGLLFLILFL